MDGFQRLFLFAALAVLIFTVLKWVRILRRLNEAVQAAQARVLRDEVDDEAPQED